MPKRNLASRAYAAVAVRRTTRQQDADVFLLVTARLQGAQHASPIDRVRALADNRRLWTAVSDLMRDGNNPLPPATRAGVVSIGLTVQREMDANEPNFDFLIGVNKRIAEGLAGNP